MNPRWIRPSACDHGQCVEVAYVHPSASMTNGSCVEAGPGTCGMVHVRDSKLGDASPVIVVTTVEWANVVERINTDRVPPYVFPAVGGIRMQRDQVLLDFTDAEWAAFVAGVKNREFDFATTATGAREASSQYAALRAVDDPAKLARAAHIIRAALQRR